MVEFQRWTYKLDCQLQLKNGRLIFFDTKMKINLIEIFFF